MGLLLITGRVLFSAIFVLAAWQKINDFGHDGGAAAKTLSPRYALFHYHIYNFLGFDLPHVEIKRLLLAAIGLEGLGGLLFMLGSSLGVYLLLIFLAAVTPIMHDFYNFDFGGADYVNQFMQFLKNLSLFGALLFYLALKNSATKRRKKTKTA
ncbi:unnamed protein product [Calypogeia fissa]